MSDEQMTFQNDLALVARIVNDDEAAADEFVRKHYEQFVRLAGQAGISPGDIKYIARTVRYAMIDQMRRELFQDEDLAKFSIAAKQRRAQFIAEAAEQQRARFIADLQPSFFLLISGLISFIVLRLLTTQELTIALGTFNFGIIGMWALAYLSKIHSLKKTLKQKHDEPS